MPIHDMSAEKEGSLFDKESGVLLVGKIKGKWYVRREEMGSWVYYEIDNPQAWEESVD